MIDSRQQRLLRTIWTHGPLSRWELHEQTGLSPNGVGVLADTLINSRILREGSPEASRMGRPRVPLEIDPETRHMLGVALVPGRVEIARLGLRGDVLDTPLSSEVRQPSQLVSAAAELIQQQVNEQTLAVGVSVTGFVDASLRTVLLSSALPGKSAESLAGIFDAIGDRPAVLGNDMHGLAARWLLTHRAEQEQDVLLVWFTDGRLGSALLIGGRPNRGCATGANELGHTRLLVETERCFCGQTGCLERIVSTPFLRQIDRSTNTSFDLSAASTLDVRAARYLGQGSDGALDRMLAYLSNALANAINFIRPHRLVLVSPLTQHPALANELTHRTRSLVLQGLSDLVQIQCWDQPASGSAENASWLAMAELLFSGWDVSEPPRMSPTAEQAAVKISI